MFSIKPLILKAVNPDSVSGNLPKRQEFHVRRFNTGSTERLKSMTTRNWSIVWKAPGGGFPSCFTTLSERNHYCVDILTFPYYRFLPERHPEDVDKRYKISKTEPTKAMKAIDFTSIDLDGFFYFNCILVQFTGEKEEWRQNLNTGWYRRENRYRTRPKVQYLFSRPRLGADLSYQYPPLSSIM